MYGIMTQEILEKLFDSPVKVKLLKLFFRNPDTAFEMSEASKKTKTPLPSCRGEIKKLESIDVINGKYKKRKKVYSINPNFAFYNELRTLVLKSSPTSKERILKRLKALGRIKLVILSGIFLDTENSRVDILIIGDHVGKEDKQKRLNRFFKDLEAEVGKEIDYVLLSTDEFKYRYSMFDRFILDILEKPHEKLINKLRI